MRSEVGIIGREGFIGSSIVLFADSGPFEVVVQIEGRALRIRKEDLQQAMRQSQPLLAALLRFIHVFCRASNPNCHCKCPLLAGGTAARWLLMCQDRGDTAEFTMTHQFLSVMLALQSPGVVEALSVLEDKNIISATKGKVMVHDRPGLEAIVRGAYGLPEQEYSRLIAPFP